MRQTIVHPVILILLLWLAGLGAAAQFAKLAVPFTEVRALYPEAGHQIGWMLTLISAIGAMLGMTAGVLVTRIGLGKAVVLALILGGCISLWQATLPGLNLMLISRLIEGLSHLLIVVAAPTLIAQVSPPRFRGMSMTLWSTFFGVAFALMAWGGLPLVAHWGLSGLWATHGVFMLGLAAVLAGFPGILRRPEPMDQRPLGILAIFQQHKMAYGSAHIAAPAIGWFFYTMTFVALLAVLPALLPLCIRATVVGIMPLMSIVVALIVVSIALEFTSAVTTTIVGFALSAVSIVFFFFDVPLAYVAIGLFTVLGLVQGASFAAVPELNTTDETRALANGAIAQMGNLGNLIGTPFLLGLMGFFGSAGMLMAVACVYLGGGAAHVLLARARRRSLV